MTTTTTRTIVAGTVLTGALLGGLGLASAASASGGGGGISRTVACSTGTLTVKAKADNGLIEVEAELDTNRVGQTWTWSLTDNGVKVGSGSKTTVAPSGSWTAKRSITNRAGTDALRFRTVRGTTACAVSLAL